MKKLLPVLAVLLLSYNFSAAQFSTNDAHLGVKAGANSSTLKVFDDLNENLYSTGSIIQPVGGLFGNLPIGKRLSIQLEALYSGMGGTFDSANGRNDFTQRLYYLSIPAMIKIHLTNRFKVTLGGQWDYNARAMTNRRNLDKDSAFTKNKDDIRGDFFGVNAGAEFWLNHNWVINGRYIYGLTDVTRFNPVTKARAIQLTLGYRFGKKPVPVPVVPPPPPDTDGDGIADPLDKCPTVAGVAEYEGCPVPDTDGDGINDKDDKCPTVPGLAKYNGCPIPDTDGDGINDEEDKCPTVAGLAKYNGCPIPDTDGDGINDEEDRCPDVAGVIENKGCPKIDFQAHDVTFQSGKSVLLAYGKKELDILVDLLNKNPNVRVKLEGHTDNTGTDKVNDPLSTKRAEAAKTYMVSKGIDAGRLETEGFGSKVPVADNKTAEGRKLNRRVEVRVL